MADNNNFQEFSEKDAVKFVRQKVNSALSAALTDDDILDIVEASYDFYDKGGFLDFSDLDSDVDADELAEYVMANIDAEVSKADVLEVLKAEDEYEDSLNDF